MYTGNTYLKAKDDHDLAVYPCVYREHRYQTSRKRRRIGLSLCIQGTLQSVAFFQLESRFIPVYTGNTRVLKRMGTEYPVYPCVYREHVWMVILNKATFGLSLCIQGTP